MSHSHTFHRLQLDQLCVVQVMLTRMMTRMMTTAVRTQITRRTELTGTAAVFVYYQNCQTELLWDDTMLYTYPSDTAYYTPRPTDILISTRKMTARQCRCGCMLYVKCSSPGVETWPLPNMLLSLHFTHFTCEGSACNLLLSFTSPAGLCNQCYNVDNLCLCHKISVNLSKWLAYHIVMAPSVAVCSQCSGICPSVQPNVLPNISIIWTLIKAHSVIMD